MACRLKRRLKLCRKLVTLRNLTNSNSVTTSSIIMDALLYICALKLKLEALKRQNMELLNHNIQPNYQQEVKVEKHGNGFIVKARSEKRGQENHFVSILESFEELGLAVLEARVSSDDNFEMEAYVEVDYQQGVVMMEEKPRMVIMDAEVVTQAVLGAFKNKTKKLVMTHDS